MFSKRLFEIFKEQLKEGTLFTVKKEKPILERDIKKYFLKIAKSYKAEVRKCEWYMRKDAPDWFVALNGARFVELKRPGEVPRPSQQREFDRLARKGVVVHVLDTYDKVDDFFDWISKCE